MVKNLELPPRPGTPWTASAEQDFLADKYAGDEGSQIRVAQHIVAGFGRGITAAAELAQMRDPVFMAEKIRFLEAELKRLCDKIDDLRWGV